MAMIAMLLWPLVALILFRRLEAVPGLIWGIVLPYLFLPEAFEIALPALPDLNKTSIITIGLVLGYATNREKFHNELLRNPLTLANARLRLFGFVCFWVLVLGAVFTVLGNGDVLRYGPIVLPPMRPWDAISMTGDIVFFIAPFFFARRYLARPEAHRALMSAFVVMALIYSFLMLIEMRLSPQLHNWVYGYHQHSFLQHIRDGYRPKVFLAHGLWVGFFMFMATVSAFSLWRVTAERKWLFAGGWLFIILALSANLGAFLIAVIVLAMMFGLSQRLQILLALGIAGTTLFYPMLRQAQLIPIDQIMAGAAKISAERAQSLLFRLDNEDQLLEKALERPIAGWGGFSRERVYNEEGRDISVSEGRWIQMISTRGWLGYIGLFGLLTAPILFLSQTRKRKPIPPETLGLALIIMGNLIYMIPNSTLTAIGWLVFGALAGFVQYDSETTGEGTEKSKRGGGRSAAKGRYTRFQPQ